MAEPSAPEPRAGGIVGRLTAKAGPLPVWAWALVILVGGYLAYRLLGNKAGSSSTTADTTVEDTPTPAIDSDTTPVGGDTGSPPGQSGMGSSADNLSADLYGQLTGLQGSVDALTSAVQLSPAFWPGDESTAGSGSGVPNGTTPATPAKQAAAKKAPAKPAAKAKAPASVRYYTYAPGKAPKNQKGNEAPGKGPAGTTLRFAKGKGYYYA